MDISPLSLALGAPVEQTGQTPVASGFDLTLEQAEVGGFIPPGAPPGPEPPPDIFVAGEGVEVLEPTAQPQKLDFLPQTKIDLDVELPKPFWEEPIDGDLPVCPTADEESTEPSKPVDEAMEWLVGQMAGGFFASPVLNNSQPTPFQVPTTDRILVHSDSIPTPDIQTSANQGQASPLPSNTDAGFTEVVDEAAPRIAPEIVETLNVESVEVHTPQVAKLELTTETEFRANLDAPKTVPVAEAVAVEIPVAVKPEAQPIEAKPVEEKAPQSPVEAKKEVIPGEVAKVAPAEGRPSKPVEKTPNESTALEVNNAAAKIDKSANTDSQKEFGQSTKDGNTFDKAVVEPKAQTQEAQPAELKHVRPDLAVDSVQTVRAPGTIEPKPEALTPKEVDLVVRQVVDKLHMLAAARPKNGVTIHLNPEDLGSITVVVKSIGRMVETQLSATDQRVRQALDQNHTRLVEAMDARGFQVQNVTVSAQTNSSTQHESTRNWQQPSQQQNNSQSGQSHGHRGQGDRHFEQPKSNIRAWVRRGEGVDLSI